MDFILKEFLSEQYHPRVDTFLKNELDMCDSITINSELLSRSCIQSIIKDYGITINGELLKKCNVSIEKNDLVSIKIPNKFIKSDRTECCDIDLNIVYEDNDIIVVNKHAGLVVHPGVKNEFGTLVDALYFRNIKSTNNNQGQDFEGCADDQTVFPKLAHRIDKDTTGLVVAAKNPEAYEGLVEQFANRTAKRFYYGLVWGVPGKKSDSIVSNFGRDAKNRIKMAVLSDQQNGKNAITHYFVKESFQINLNNSDCLQLSLVKCNIETGRTHQIRVHMNYIGHSVVGDSIYSSKKDLEMNDSLSSWLTVDISRQMLHAYNLEIVHPITKDKMKFSAEVPEDMKNLYQKLKMMSSIIEKKLK
jgi:23S rRNA pseudouridine1911/1915/1917 synthase